MKNTRLFFLRHSYFISSSFIILIALLAFLDIFREYNSGESVQHLIYEFIIAILAALWGFYLISKWREASSELKVTQRTLEARNAENDKWRKDYTKLLQGVADSIDQQFETWGLTQAEKQVAMLLLKGLSFKEISDLRETSEKTTRQQATVIYQKSNLPGRAELSAFFLEDFLAPPRT